MWVRNHVERILEKHNVDLYFCGHEHDIQYIKPKDKRTHYEVSGAGSEVRSTGMHPESLFVASEESFVSTSITKNSLKNQFLNYKDELIYSFSIMQLMTLKDERSRALRFSGFC